MSAKHTPGPWKVITERSANDAFVFEIAEVSSYRVIPDRADTFSEEGDAFADARLIAAAPELLEALQEVLPMLENLLMIRGDPEPGSIGYRARAAIAKATGVTT